MFELEFDEMNMESGKTMKKSINEQKTL